MRILIFILVASLIGVPSAYALVSIKCETASDPKKWKRQKNLRNKYFIVAIETEGEGENKIEKGTYQINTNSGDALNLNLQQDVDKVWIAKGNRGTDTYTYTYTYIDRKTLDYMTWSVPFWNNNYKYRPIGKCEVLEMEVFNSEIENILKEKGQGNKF